MNKTEFSPFGCLYTLMPKHCWKSKGLIWHIVELGLCSVFKSLLLCLSKRAQSSQSTFHRLSREVSTVLPRRADWWCLGFQLQGAEAQSYILMDNSGAPR